MKKLLLLLLLAVAAVQPMIAQADTPKLPDPATRLAGYAFGWGAQIGGSIDMTGNNMSTVDFAATVGLRHLWMKLLGVGFGANVMASNSCRSYLVFANLRTDFLSTRRGLLFMDTRLGIANNTFPHNVQRTGFYGYMGLGVNLATSRTFSSHVSLGYTFVQRGRVNTTDADGNPESHYLQHLQYATVALGITF